MTSGHQAIYQGHVGVGYFLFEGHALNLEASAGHIDGTAAGLELLLRSHWIRGANWSLFLEGGAGVLWTENPFPSGGTRWNFTPQAGGGLTWRLAGHTHLLTGARWYHISNANTHGAQHNPAYNGAMEYVGVLFTY